MATRSGPASGDLSLAEIKEFAGFAAGTQRYIRRSLDIGLERDDAIARWSRDMVEETAIRVQARVYQRLGDIRTHIPEDSGLDALEGFMAPLVAVSAFDLGQDRLPTFAPRQAQAAAPIDQRSRRYRARLVGARTELLSRMDRKDRRDQTGQLNARPIR